MSVADVISTPVILTAIACLYLGYALGTRSTAKKAESVLGWRTQESERLRLDAENRYIETWLYIAKRGPSNKRWRKPM